MRSSVESKDVVSQCSIDIVKNHGTPRWSNPVSVVGHQEVILSKGAQILSQLRRTLSFLRMSLLAQIWDAEGVVNRRVPH